MAISSSTPGISANFWPSASSAYSDSNRYGPFRFSTYASYKQKSEKVWNIQWDLHVIWGSLDISKFRTSIKKTSFLIFDKYDNKWTNSKIIASLRIGNCCYETCLNHGYWQTCLDSGYCVDMSYPLQFDLDVCFDIPAIWYHKSTLRHRLYFLWQLKYSLLAILIYMWDIARCYSESNRIWIFFFVKCDFHLWNLNRDLSIYAECATAVICRLWAHNSPTMTPKHMYI